MGKKAGGGKKLPQAPLAVRQEQKKVIKPIAFEKKTRNFRIGGDIQPPRDLTKFVKWPLYVQLQRKKRIMLQRLKVPPSLAQFQHTLDRTQCTQLFRVLKKLAPETKAEKKERLTAEAAAKADGKSLDKKAPTVLKFGLNHITTLVEEKKAKLVVIAHDVDPIELVAWLPALCRKKEVPYCIVKGKSRLGQLVGKKTASCLAVTSVKSEDQKDLNTLCASFMDSFNNNVDVRRTWGGGIMGVKSQHVQKKRHQLLERELAKKTGLGV
jgi:large subunit ribosomal protein L7Ae